MNLRIEWPTALVFAVVVVALVAAYLFGPALGVPESSHEALMGAIGTAGGLVLAIMRPLIIPLLTADKDGDGIPDWRDPPSDPPPPPAAPADWTVKR